MANEYELIYIVVPGLEQSANDALGEEVSQQIQQGGGTVDNIRTSDMRQLAYEIKGHTEGLYVVVNFHGEAGAMAELDRWLGLHQSIIRHMTIRIDD